MTHRYSGKVCCCQRGYQGADQICDRCRAEKVGFRAIKPKDENHAAVLADLARRIDDE